MKRHPSLLLAAALAAAFFVTTAGAQPAERKGPRGDRPPRPGMEMLGKHIAKELGLSEDQKKQIKAINESYRPLGQAIRGDQALTPGQKLDKQIALNKERQAKVDAVLTPEQRTKAQEMREKMRERAKERREHGPGGPEDHDGPPPPPKDE